ncbi:Cof-type HAD-IIB family hydrolase [Reinekea sp.]|jgi:Cof subfamily protein (haloacid dehalogenase superfamily)|uniref:Cof-type HAD-IIB family hydrolase n=1 Tax=Reinekea sp. TaxID=1970455 RepID=UPI003989164F
MPYQAIRMIVMDMDDTLLNSKLQVSDANRAALKRAQLAGITLVLASGRPTPAMSTFADELAFTKNGFVISYNGAYVTDWSNQKVLFDTCLTKIELDLLIDIAREQSCNLHTYVEGEIITNIENPHTDFEAELTGMPVRIVSNMKALVTEKVPKVLLTGPANKVKQMKETLAQQLGDQFMISISKPVFLEFTNLAVDKSRGIDVICKKLDIEKTHVMALGDSYNDLTMIRDCGLGVAMGNAPDDIKALANEVTLNCEENGVAVMINRVIDAIEAK